MAVGVGVNVLVGVAVGTGVLVGVGVGVSVGTGVLVGVGVSVGAGVGECVAVGVFGTARAHVIARAVAVGGSGVRVGSLVGGAAATRAGLSCDGTSSEPIIGNQTMPIATNAAAMPTPKATRLFVSERLCAGASGGTSGDVSFSAGEKLPDDFSLKFR